MLIDAFVSPDLVSNLGTKWQGVSDQVMGGISEPSVLYANVDGKPCLKVSGDVRLENNGGFIQAILDLAQTGETLDVSAFTGFQMEVRGNNEEYAIHLRTTDLLRPQHSYRQSFIATPEWQTVYLPFADLKLHRTDIPFNPKNLRRLGLAAIGRAFFAELNVSRIALY